MALDRLAQSLNAVSLALVKMSATLTQVATHVSTTGKQIVDVTKDTSSSYYDVLNQMMQTTVDWGNGVTLDVGQTLENLAAMIALQKELMNGNNETAGTGQALIFNSEQIEKLVQYLKSIFPSFDLTQFKQYINAKNGATAGGTTPPPPNAGATTASKTGTLSISNVLTPTTSATTQRAMGDLP